MIFFLTACQLSKTTDSAQLVEPDNPPYDNVTLSTQQPPEGDLSCFPQGKTDQQDFIQETVSPTKAVSHAVKAEVVRFSGEPVPHAQINIYANNNPNSEPSDIWYSDENGQITDVFLDSCTPYAYTVEISGYLYANETGQMEVFSTQSQSENEFNAFSSEEYHMIMENLQIEPDPLAGAVIGLLSDCNDDALKGVEVILRDEAGIRNTQLSVYYIDEEGTFQQGESSKGSGMWFVPNIPQGKWIVQMYGYIDGAPRLLGQGPLYSYPNGISFINILAGFDGGYRYPPSCF